MQPNDQTIWYALGEAGMPRDTDPAEAIRKLGASAKMWEQQATAREKLRAVRREALAAKIDELASGVESGQRSAHDALQSLALYLIVPVEREASST